MSISIQEVGGSPKEKYSLDGFSATRTFVLPWASRDEFAQYFLGDRAYSSASLETNAALLSAASSSSSSSSSAAASVVQTQSGTSEETSSTGDDSTAETSALPEQPTDPSGEDDSTEDDSSGSGSTGGTSTSTTTGTTRLQYPGKPGAYVVSVEFEPLDPASLDVVGITAPATTLGRYRSLAKATVKYRAETTSADRADLPSVASGTKLTYKMIACGETISASPRGWRWSDDATSPVPDDLPLVKRVPTTEHQLIWSSVVRPPWGTISAAQGTVNATAFLGYAAGTLLFEGAEANKIYDGEVDAGAVGYAWQIRFIFREKRVDVGSSTFGWNDFYRESTGTWERLVDAAGNPLYRSSEHSSLFVQAAAETTT